MTNQMKALVAGQIKNPDTQWSLGTFGGIAEFCWDVDEKVHLGDSGDAVSAATDRGGVTINFREAIRPFASESITKQGWSHRVALCLPETSCAMNRRTGLTELGPDEAAMREADRNGILFDLGLDVLQADLCVRIADGECVRKLREYTGRAVFETGNPAMGIILAASPHRVFLSRIGRVEVYQPIPAASGKSPDGPHTHVLPKLLKSRRTHPATEPIPAGWVPCAHLYPAHPAKDAFGVAIPFVSDRHQAFQSLIDAWGDPEIAALKNRVISSIDDNREPSPADALLGRNGRTAIRVTLRQLLAHGHSSKALPAWVEIFDRQDGSDEEDDSAKQHQH